MDKRVIIIFVLLIYVGDTSTVQGSIFKNLLNFFTGNEENDVAGRQKRITTDEGNKAIGLEVRGFRNGEKDEEEADLRRSVNEELTEIYNTASHTEKSSEKKLKTRSVHDNEASAPGQTKFLEYATMRSTNKNDEKKENIVAPSDGKQVRSSRSKFENVNSREEKEMSSIKTVSSLSVPANDMSGSGEEDDTPLTEVSTWPKGRYGLPKSVFGCPKSIGFRWKTGFRYHDTEDDGTENQRSDVFTLAANFSEDGISHEFCIKDDFEGEGDWPTGKYCIYKRGPVCPTGLKEGFVIWDDENTDNQNDKGGALPEGEYTEDTKIYFCCSTTGVVDNQISLPAKSPFFLFAYESFKCQKVLNMKSTSEFIKFDDEDHGNTDHEGGEYPYGIHKFQKDHMLFLCYYEPTKPVHSYNAESALATNLEEESAKDEEQLDQESIRQSEEIMKAFMKATGGVEDETSKRERTKTIIKTIKVPVNSKNSPVATVIGLVLGSIVIGTIIIFITKLVIPTRKGQDNIRPDPQDLSNEWKGSHVGNISVQALYENENVQSAATDISDDEADDSDGGDKSPSCYTASEVDSWSDLEEDDELVEDQLLPDSELKSGLELLFLKQQRHYWNQRRRHEQRDHSQ